MASLTQLETALRNADAAGDTDAARRLASVIRKERGRRESDPSIALSEQIPDTPPMDVPGTVAQAPDPTMGQQVVGAGETALTAATGAVGGTAGLIGGTLKGLAEEILTGRFGSVESANRVEQSAMEGASALTYQPRTEAGQEQVEALGEIAEPLAAIAPAVGPIGAVSQSARMVRPLAAGVVADKVVAPAVRTASRIAAPRPETSTPSRMSAGASAVDDSTLRQARANELPVPIKLTQGQKTRDFNDQQFERETAKREGGAPIRERFEDQNRQLMQNMESFIDATGSEITDLRGVGELVNSALRNRAARDKSKYRTLYKEAEKAGEMEEPADVQPLAQYLNENRAERAENGIMGKVQRQIDALEIGEGNFEEGSLQLRPVTLKEAEAIRRFINRNVNNNDPNDIRIASALKREIDTATEGLGGNTYKKARAARAKYAQDYENAGLIKNLLGTKRGSEDRAIAFEDVLRKTLLEPSSSLDSVKQVRRLLQTEGDEGKQAWKELQGGVLRHIQDQMTKGVATNSKGDRVVSAVQLDRVISKLDQSGKLDYIFGKKGAEQLRTINDVAKDVLTSPPGSVNHSNTAAVLAGLMDVALTASTGIPAPVASGFKLVTDRIKDKKLRARVKQVLGEE